MSLFFDHNLSPRLPKRLADIFPGCKHTSTFALSRSEDSLLWEQAKAAELAIITFDRDFVEKAERLGPPPKIIHITTGNLTRAAAEQMVRLRMTEIKAFLNDANARLMRLP